ncbi:hypothetical protein NUW58_g2072 [Xylaria curta]|uniref:Uncharacterized protein n=1 Tax=Xylaria curta TaxID=42375 RepID=A0ACC1PHC5_9PEZI|nr:hypothetical protein NUW58_g2072 [Xylaria curta]
MSMAERVHHTRATNAHAQEDASRTLQAQDLVYEQQQFEVGSHYNPHIGAPLGMVIGHESRIQRHTVVGVGYDDAGSVGGTIPNYVSSTRRFESAGRASNYPAANEYSRRGRHDDNRSPQGQNEPQPGRAGRRITIRICHMQPGYCPKCGTIFQDDIEHLKRDDHIDRCVADDNPSPPPGMTLEQLTEMGDAANSRRSVSDEERWNEIWRIMFPNEGCPQSPYIDPYSEWCRIGARDAVERYLQSGRLPLFMAEYSKGVDTSTTLWLLLNDLICFTDGTALSNHNPSCHPNLRIDGDDGVDGGGHGHGSSYA